MDGPASLDWSKEGGHGIKLWEYSIDVGLCCRRGIFPKGQEGKVTCLITP